MVDGVIITVNASEGVNEFTETIIRQVFMERIRPVLVIDGIEQLFLKHYLKEEIYEILVKIIDSFDTIIAKYTDEALGDCRVCPLKGIVVFSSSHHSWAFSLDQFATRYANKFNFDKKEMLENLWGDVYFDNSSKKWTTKDTTEDGIKLERGFCLLILDLILHVYDANFNDKVQVLKNFIEKLKIDVDEDDFDNFVNNLPRFRYLMRRFLPVSEAVLEMVAIHLPSPLTAQPYRCELIYDGPAEDECALAIKNCDPNGPLMMYVSHMRKTKNTDQIYAFGRVFSGIVKEGMTVRVQGPEYVPGSQNDLYIKNIERTAQLSGSFVEPNDSYCTGNIVALIGIGDSLLNSGTITTSESAHNMRIQQDTDTVLVQAEVNVEESPDT